MTCLNPIEISMDEWGQELIAPLNNGRYPISGSIDLTERCNLNCVHCYINQPASCEIAKKSELNTDQVKNILDRIADAGCLFLVLTGGEPLLRPDFPEIYIHAKQRGMLVTLFTNAAMVTPKIADLLAASQPHVVEVTLYGATESTYEAVTRVPGSFKRFMRGLDLLFDRGIRVALKAMILTLNKHELSAMKDLVESYGVEFRYDGSIFPRLDGSQAPYQYRLSVEEMLAMDLEYPDRAQEWRERSNQFEGVLVRNDFVFSCGAGLRNFHIDSRGRMSICTMARQPAFDLQKMSFQEAWSRLGELRKMKRQLHTKCETCTVGALCAQCPAWSQMVHGDNETPVEFVCQLGQARAKLFSSEFIRVAEEVKYE